MRRGLPRLAAPAWWRERPPSFSCTVCGVCCSRSWSDGGTVLVNEKEVLGLSRLKGITPAEFVERYTVPSVDGPNFSGPVQPSAEAAGGKGHRELRFVPRADGESEQCIFLEGKACSVHEARPTQCRTYPFWPHMLKDRTTFEAQRERCPGIGEGAALDPDEITATAIIQTVDLDARGAFTYEEANGMIRRGEVSRDLLDTYEAELSGGGAGK